MNEDMIGKRFGRLTVISFSHHRVYRRGENGTQKYQVWLCRCDCGNETKVGRSDLTQGRIKSCGCLKAEKAGALRKNMKGPPKKSVCVVLPVWMADWLKEQPDFTSHMIEAAVVKYYKLEPPKEQT